MKPMVKPKVTLCTFNPAFSTDQVESGGHGGQILCFFEFEGFNDPWRVFFFYSSITPSTHDGDFGRLL